MFKLSVHEKVEYEREKVYLCRKEMFHLLIYIRSGKDNNRQGSQEPERAHSPHHPGALRQIGKQHA